MSEAKKASRVDAGVESARPDSMAGGDLEKFPGSAEVMNPVYDNAEEEPVLHLRTWVALAAMFVMNFTQTFALQGPPSVLSYIGSSLNNPQAQTWVPNALALMQAVVCPLFSSTSDVFQARKLLLVSSSVVSFIGAAIAPGSQDIYRLIAATVLIGVGFASVGLAFAVPSEIVPRKWRPMAQALMNLAAALGAVASPLVIGAFTKADVINGWKKFYWVQMALWGTTAVGIFFGYRPPKRHTRLDHLSFWQKLGQLDLAGFGLLTAGLTLTLVALNLGGGLYAWTAAPVLATLVVGLVTLVCFGIYEWKGTKTGILHHGLFQGGKGAGLTFSVCVLLMFIEGILLFSYVLFYPIMTGQFFEQDPFTLAVRALPFWVVSGISTVGWGYWSMKLKTIRSPLFTGFLIYTAALVGFATIQPSHNVNALAFAGLAGLGFGAPLVLIISGVQLSTPHHLIATATAVTTSARAVGATVFTAIYFTAFNTGLGAKMPAGIASAAVNAGLAPAEVPDFIGALTAGNTTALAAVPGASPAVVEVALAAMKQSFADSIRVVFFIAIPFGVVACVACFLLRDLTKMMDYRVDAPVEMLEAKSRTTAS